MHRFLVKNATQSGVNGHAYQATLVETQAITRLARRWARPTAWAPSSSPTASATPATPATRAELYQLWTDYQTDLAAITGQTQKIQMIVSQQNSINDRAASTLAQWKIGVDHPADVVCSGPKYQYPYYSDNVHLVTDGLPPAG